jgi:hypothetical protein
VALLGARCWQQVPLVLPTVLLTLVPWQHRILIHRRRVY